jgi:amino acid transporter
MLINNPNWIQWAISLAYVAFVILGAFADPAMSSRPLATVSLTSQYNGVPVLYANVLFWLLVVFTAFCSWRVTIINGRIRRHRLANPKNRNIPFTHFLKQEKFQKLQSQP